MLAWVQRMLAALMFGATALAVAGLASAEKVEGPQFQVDLNKYAGLWHEIARTPNWFQDNKPRRNGKKYSPCFATTATYGLLDAQSISIDNKCSRASTDGEIFLDEAHGVARIVPASGNRKLKVAFGPAVPRYFERLFTGGGAGYWIYCIGSENEDGKYSWAVVSGPKRDFLYLLAREPSVSEATNKEMLTCVRAEGLPVDRLIYRSTQPTRSGT